MYAGQVEDRFGELRRTPMFVEGNVLGVIGYPLALTKEMSDVIYLPDPSFPSP
jgi:hypothetical protein